MSNELSHDDKTVTMINFYLSLSAELKLFYESMFSADVTVGKPEYIGIDNTAHIQTPETQCVVLTFGKTTGRLLVCLRGMTGMSLAKNKKLMKDSGKVIADILERMLFLHEKPIVSFVSEESCQEIKWNDGIVLSFTIKQKISFTLVFHPTDFIEQLIGILEKSRRSVMYS